MSFIYCILFFIYIDVRKFWIFGLMNWQFFSFYPQCDCLRCEEKQRPSFVNGLILLVLFIPGLRER